MVARVTHVNVSPDDIDESVRLFEEAVVPAAQQEAGFMGALLLVRSDGQAIVIDLADTIENMQANERSGFYQSQVAQFADKVVGHPTRALFDVRVAKGVKGGAELLES